MANVTKVAKSPKLSKNPKVTKVAKVPKRGTIGFMTLELLRDNPNVTTEECLKVILPKFPESKFDKAHLAWYRHQVKMQNYGFPEKPKKSQK